MSERRPTVLSLFSGVGGFDMGLERAGFETVYQCEIDKNARSVLDRHWPDVPKWGDISTLTADEILRHTSHIDVVAWGSPCQDLSVAGKRAGLDGDRSSLFHEGVRLITELRKATDNEYPRFSIWENVAGALSSNSGRDFHTVIDQMAEAGAHLQEYALLDSQYFGIPQRRRRVFLLSVFHSDIADRCADPLLPVSESMRRDTAQSTAKGQATARATAESTGIDSDWDIEQPIVGSLQAHLSQGASADDAAHGLLIPTHSSQVCNTPVVAYSIREDAKANNFSATEITSSRALQAHQPSVQSHHAQTFIASDAVVRRLLPIECERLMGWPDDHTRWKADGTEQADSHRYKQCGNGVASPVATWIGEQIRVYL